MTPISCDNIYFYKVGIKAHDIIMYYEYTNHKLSQKEDYIETIKRCVKDNQYPGNRPGGSVPSPRTGAHLEIHAESGKNVYAVWLGNVKFTTFGTEHPPISALSDFLPPQIKYISDVTLYYAHPTKPVTAVTEADKWKKPDGYEDPIWASFIFDAAAVPKTPNVPHFIPLYFNLYVGTIPNWIAANHEHPHENDGHQDSKHGKRGIAKVHGGIHPDLPNNYLITGP